MRTWILSLLLIVALVATFNLVEGKSETEVMQAPSTLPAEKDKKVEKKGRRHSRRKGGKHNKDSERRREKRRIRHRRCKSDSDCKNGKKCIASKRGKFCRNPRNPRPNTFS